MKVMGLDTSTKTGVSIIEFIDGEINITAEEIEFKKARGLDRCSMIAGAIITLMEEHKPDITIIEGYGYGNAHTLVTLVEIGTVIRYFLKQYEMPYIDVTPNTLKKFVTGKGNAGKEMIMMQVLKRWGYESATNNIADAIGLGMLGGALYGQLTMPEISMGALDPVRRAGIPTLK
ncbi:MAG: hypothetical protein GQ570_03540 [Helicobacteraceae bacterium]|nr:hypothetical protein [Helicobacteraceae bacterium]